MTSRVTSTSKATASVAGKQLRWLLSQIQVVNSINTALSTTTNMEEIHRIILSALTSKLGLGFSRAFLFLYKPVHKSLTGKYAVGPSSKQEAEAWVRKHSEQHDLIDQLQRGLDAPTKEPARPFRGNGSERLKSGRLWLELFEEQLANAALTKKIEQIYFDFRIDRAQKKDLRTSCSENRICVCEKSHARSVFPAELLGYLDGKFLVLPLTTKKGLHGIVIVDRKFDRKAITKADVRYLDWFKMPFALAIENAELFTDLEFAYSEVQQLDALKSNFLAVISHELRTPLTAIQGFVDLLIGGKVGRLSASQRDLLARVSRNAAHLISMVNDVIEVAEIEAQGLSERHLEPVDPLDAFMATLPRLEQRRETKRVTIEPILKEQIPKILAEQKALERILYHLLDNAVKFSPNDSRVWVEFERIEDKLSIHVRDQGIGIHSLHLKKIFDYFYQVDNKLTRSYEGLGLGLATTRVLLLATGGEITVKSSPGSGSDFAITYPIVESGR
jgi:signal transduction histidine kinase